MWRLVEIEGLKLTVMWRQVHKVIGEPFPIWLHASATIQIRIFCKIVVTIMVALAYFLK